MIYIGYMKLVGSIFHPLICKHSFYPRRGCELEIEILSNDPFGAIYSNGDLDNRLKTLFDALCLPNKHQLPSVSAQKTAKTRFGFCYQMID